MDAVGDNGKLAETPVTNSILQDFYCSFNEFTLQGPIPGEVLIVLQDDKGTNLRVKKTQKKQKKHRRILNPNNPHTWGHSTRC